MAQKNVLRFCIQPTPSFQVAPQREEYESDEEHLAHCVRYGAEWRKEYRHEGACVDHSCPQCHGGRVVLARERARAGRLTVVK